MAQLSRNQARIKKHRKIRAKLSQGTANRPRLVVFRSSNNFYAQLVDDTKAHTLAAVSTLKEEYYGGNIEAANKIGKVMAQKIKELAIESIVFDRAGYLYHGRVKAFAEAIREEGIKF